MEHALRSAVDNETRQTSAKPLSLHMSSWVESLLAHGPRRTGNGPVK